MDTREQRVAGMAAEALARLDLSGCALVMDDETDLVASAMASMGVEVSRWERRVKGSVSAAVWPACGPFDVVTLRQPRSREAFEMGLHVAGSRLGCGGRLVAYGANDEGIRSASRPIRALFGNVTTVDSRRHCRVLQAVLPPEPPVFRSALADWRSEGTATLADGQRLRWVSYPGMFAHGRLDEGTRVLLDALPTLEPRQRALDFGCGAGLIAAALLRRQRTARVDLLDDDALAIEAARENVPRARAILGDAWDALGGATYDLIVSNPPIHRGKEKDFGLLERFIDGARPCLRPYGYILFVVQRAAPTARLLAASDDDYDVAAETTRYRVWRVRCGDSRASTRRRHR